MYKCKIQRCFHRTLESGKYPLSSIHQCLWSYHWSFSMWMSTTEFRLTEWNCTRTVCSTARIALFTGASKGPISVCTSSIRITMRILSALIYICIWNDSKIIHSSCHCRGHGESGLGDLISELWYVTSQYWSYNQIVNRCWVGCRMAGWLQYCVTLSVKVKIHWLISAIVCLLIVIVPSYLCTRNHSTCIPSRNHMWMTHQCQYKYCEAHRCQAVHTHSHLWITKVIVKKKHQSTLG